MPSLFDNSTVPAKEKERIAENLQKWGIVTNMQDGTIDYADVKLPEIKCESIHLIRHAETVAVAKHEFMSDTSDNCSFTENGIAITRRQAGELAAYHFDVALFGPIDRVFNTMKLIMETPQEFDCVYCRKLHGIDNTGWEYKSFFDLEHTPLFIAREIENNMFARTPRGTSWGTVIANCVDVLELINEKYAGKRILLITQGSVLRGFEILLRKRKHPWDDYTVSGMYHVGDDSNKKKNYGVISRVF